MGIEGIALIENPTAVGKLASMMHEEACLKRKKKEKLVKIFQLIQVLITQ